MNFKCLKPTHIVPILRFEWNELANFLRSSRTTSRGPRAAEATPRQRLWRNERALRRHDQELRPRPLEPAPPIQGGWVRAQEGEGRPRDCGEGKTRNLRNRARVHAQRFTLGIETD